MRSQEQIHGSHIMLSFGCFGCPAERLFARQSSNKPGDSAGLLGGELVAKALRNVSFAADLTLRKKRPDPSLQAGVETVFGYSGGANLPVLDTFHDSPMQFIMNRSEQCCGHAAEGYAKSTGKTGA